MFTLGKLKGENMEDKKIRISCGSPLLGLLTITFIVLKLLKVINWSWFYVLLPTLISLFVVLFLLFVWFILFIFKKILNK
jgi:hypothetical protein